MMQGSAAVQGGRPPALFPGVPNRESFCGRYCRMVASCLSGLCALIAAIFRRIFSCCCGPSEPVRVSSEPGDAPNDHAARIAAFRAQQAQRRAQQAPPVADPIPQPRGPMTSEERVQRLQNAGVFLRKEPIAPEELDAVILSLQESVKGENHDDETLKAKLYNSLGTVLNKRYCLVPARVENLNLAIDALRAATVCHVANPADLRFPFYNLARLLYSRYLLDGPKKNDDLDECIVNYQFAIERYPEAEQAQLRSELADLCMLRNKPGDLERAIAHCTKAKAAEGQTLNFYTTVTAKFNIVVAILNDEDPAAANNGEARRLLGVGRQILEHGKKTCFVLENVVVLFNVALKIDFSDAELRREIAAALADVNATLSSLKSEDDELDALSMLENG